MNKKIFAFANVAFLSVGLLTTLALTSNLTVKTNAGNGPYSVVLTGKRTTTSEGIDCFTTGEGGIIELAHQGTIGQSGDNLYTMAAGSSFWNHSFIGGITKIQLDYTVDGKDPTSFDTQPLRLSYGYRAQNKDEYVHGESVNFEGDVGFRTIYEWGVDKAPSRIMLSAIMPNIAIKSLTINYGCHSHTSADLMMPNGTYLVGNFKKTDFDWTCYGGQIMGNGNNQKELINYEFHKGDQFRFKTNSDWLNVELLQSNENCAVKTKYVTKEGDNFIANGDVTLSIYLKNDNGWKAFITLQSLAEISDWWLSGQGSFIKNEQDKWGLADYLKLTPIYDENGKLVQCESTQMQLKAGDEFKFRCNDLWYAHLVFPDKDVSGGDNNNIRINTDGTYQFFIDIAGNGGITFDKLA